MPDNDFDWIWSDNTLETTHAPESRSLSRELKQQMITALKREKASEILTSLPAIGTSLHVISNGSFDYFSFVPIVIRLLRQSYTVAFYGSTWTMSRPNVVELFELFDKGQIGSIGILTGTYFKRRETAVYATLLEGIQQRGQRYIAFENHAKVMLFNHGDDYIVIEGSANFTANPRLEQTTIINDKPLWEFHRQWMNEMLNGK